MFDRFTDRARRVVVLAKDEARGFGHDYVGTEHILLGLVREGEGVVATALERLGISLAVVRAEVVEIIHPGERPPPSGQRIPFTPRARKVWDWTLREALQLGVSYIGTEHILLGLIRESDGVAAQVLIRHGANLNRIRQQVIQLVSGYQDKPSSVGRPGAGAGDEPWEVQLLREYQRERERLPQAIEEMERYPQPTQTMTRPETESALGAGRHLLITELAAVLDENRRLSVEITRLRRILRRHGINPDASQRSEHDPDSGGKASVW